MKKFFVLFILSFTFGLLATSFIAYANQTSISTYYPSPSGNYTKIHLINGVGSGGPNANTCFCAVNSGNLSGKKAGNCDTGEAGVTYPNTGTIFSDPTKASVGNNATGYLEICKNDGTASSYPGSCFNRFGSVVAVPPCPNNYRETNAANQNFPMANGKSVTSWSCCFTGEGADTEAANLSITKSGCYSIYSTAAANVPVSCSTEDVNAYDVGCDYISSPDIIPPVFKRNCCFNDTTGGTLQTSKCGGNCLLLPTVPAGAYTSCTNATPAKDTNSTVLNSCAAPAAPCTFVCATGYILDAVIPNQCDPKPCTPLNVNSNGDALTFPATASGNTATIACTAYSATTGWTGTLSDYCYLGVWAGYTGACAPDPCLAMSGPGADNAHEVSSISGAVSSGWGTATACDAGYCSSPMPQYSCSLGTYNLSSPTGSCTPCPCGQTTVSSGGASVTFPNNTPSGTTPGVTCPSGYTGTLHYTCGLGAWSNLTGACYLNGGWGAQTAWSVVGGCSGINCPCTGCTPGNKSSTKTCNNPTRDPAGGIPCATEGGATCTTTDGSGCYTETFTEACTVPSSVGVGGPWSIGNGTYTGQWLCGAYNACATGNSSNCNYYGHAPTFDCYTWQDNRGGCSCNRPGYAVGSDGGCDPEACTASDLTATPCGTSYPGCTAKDACGYCNSSGPSSCTSPWGCATGQDCCITSWNFDGCGPAYGCPVGDHEATSNCGTTNCAYDSGCPQPCGGSTPCGSPGSCYAKDACNVCNSSGPSSCSEGCTGDACCTPSCPACRTSSSSDGCTGSCAANCSSPWGCSAGCCITGWTFEGCGPMSCGSGSTPRGDHCALSNCGTYDSALDGGCT